MGRNWLEVFRVSLYTESLAVHHKKFQETHAFDTNLEYEVWSFWYHLLTTHRHDRHADTHKDIKTYTGTSKNEIFRVARKV